MPTPSLNNQCEPRFTTVDAINNCSLTHATPTVLDADAYATLVGDVVIAENVMLSEADAILSGYVQSPLDELIGGLIRTVNPDEMIKKGTEFAPFFQRPNISVINDNYFDIVGPLTSAVGAYSGSSGQYALSIASTTNLPGRATRFLPGNFIYVNTTNNDGTASIYQYKVVSASDTGTVDEPTILLIVTPTNNAPTTLTSGFVVPGVPNVDDVEEYCLSSTALKSTSFKTFWVQSTRFAFETNTETEAMIQKILSGAWNTWQKFKQLPTTKRRLQAYQAFKKAWHYTIFFGQAEDATNQTAANYQNLPTAAIGTDDSYYGQGTSYADCVIRYKANTEGIYTQLKNCGRVVDLAGDAIDLETLAETVEAMTRQRSADAGREITEVDVITDRITANAIRKAYIQYVKVEYGVDVTLQLSDIKDVYRRTGNVAAVGNNATPYESYYFPRQGRWINVYFMQAFNDLIASSASAPKYLWAIDWSDIEVVVLAKKRVEKSTDKNHPGAMCVIETIDKTVVLESTKFAVVVNRPERHLIYTNFKQAAIYKNAEGTNVEVLG